MNKFRNIGLRTLHIVLEVAKGIAIFGVVLALLLANPFVQTFLAKKATEWLKNKKNIDVKIEKFQIIFPNQIGLRNALLLDAQGDTVIYIHSFRASIAHLSSDFQKIALSKVFLDSTHYYLHTPVGDSVNGFMRFLEKLDAGDTIAQKSTFTLKINDIHFEKLRFHRIDFNNPKLPAFKVYNAHLRFRNFQLSPDSISARLVKAYGTDDQFFSVHHLEGQLTYADDHISALDLLAVTDSSRLDIDATLKYSHPNDFADFENLVQLAVEFRKTKVHITELRSLLPEFPQLPDVELNGNFSGVLNNFIVTANPIQIGNFTTLEGNVTLKNVISNPENPKIITKISSLTSQLKEGAQIIHLFTDTIVPEVLQKELLFTVKGQFEGTPNQFITDLKIYLEKGEEIKGSIQFDKTKKIAEYSGNLEIINVHLGKLLGVSSLGSTTGKFMVNGSGLTSNELYLVSSAKIENLLFNNYSYKNISLLNFTLNRNDYSGKLNIDDPNITLTADIHYRDENNNTFSEFLIKLKHSNPLALKWTKDSITYLSFTSAGILDFSEVENPSGNILINDIFAENTLGYYHFESIKILSNTIQNISHLELKSDVAYLNLSGKYKLFEFNKYFEDWLNIRLGKSVKEKNTFLEDYFSLEFKTDNLDALFNLLYINNLRIEPKTTLLAEYNGANKQISATLLSQGIQYGDIQTGNIKCKINHINQNTVEALLIAYNSRYDDLLIDSVQFQVVNTPDSNAFELLWTWVDSVGSNGHIDGWLVKNEFNHYRLHFDRSEFNIGSEKFVINRNNFFDFEPERINITNFHIINGPRSLLANGIISQNPYEIIRINLNNFRIDLFNIFLKPFNSKLDGLMQGEIIANDLLNEPKFAADFEIDSLYINGNYQGDFYFSSDWDLETKKMKILSHIQRGQLKTFEVDGVISTMGDFEIDLKAKTNRFRVNAFAPVLGEFVQNLRGTVNGDINIKGRAKALDIAGKLTFPNLGLTIPMLGTDYNFEGSPTVTVNNKEIVISEMTIRDTKTASKAVMNGRITHRNFSDFRFNIGIDADKFLALNTNATSGDLYYGTAYVTGKINITGPTDEPVIDVNVRTEKGTLFALPLNNPTEVGRLSFVNFVQKDDKKLPEKSQLNFGGITLRFTIDVTPDAEAQLILDDRYNDMMRANGQGRLSLTVPPSGNISLVGSYQINKGVYNFNFQGIVSRKFLIEPGSTITFTGDPLAANLDITTRYTTRTTLRGLLTDERYLNTRTQVDLLLKITGVMFQPEISFDIKVPRAAPMVQTEINNALADRDKLTRQAFSLLLLNSFVTDDFALGTTSSGATLVYDAFVSQISNLLGQRIKGVDIRLGYSQTNLQGQEGSVNQQQDLELGISTTLFNDRFVINTNFDLSTQQNTGSTRRNDFAGDVELEYLITSDGKLRAKAFNRSLQNRIGLEQVGDYAQGLGITYRTNFDSWYYDILRMRRTKRYKDFQFEEPDTSSDSPSIYYPKNANEWKQSSMH
ncbi:MAG: translocation/assembly module TamB domain-containing protein [Thermaurantimonas sp.]|uniref:translocation/assembly module TamB domain-containing protein n=1 Tax=Thermaurantimonas sp. TaxID=2681568 RepID=UPI003918BC22